MTTDDSSPGFFGKLFGRKIDQPVDEDPLSRLSKESAMSKNEMVSAAERFHGLKVENVMVPRADIVAVEQDEPLEDFR